MRKRKWAGKMRIRRAESEDVGALLTLYAQLHSMPVDKKPDPSVVTLWKRLVADDSQSVLVAEDGGVVVSVCVLVVVPSMGPGRPRYAFLENMITHVAHRRRGYAALLLEKAKEIARAKECDRIVTETAKDAPQTSGFCSAMGFAAGQGGNAVLWL